MERCYEIHEIIPTRRNREPISDVIKALQDRGCRYHVVVHQTLDTRREFVFLEMQNKNLEDVIYFNSNVVSIRSFSQEQMCRFIERACELERDINNIKFGMDQSYAAISIINRNLPRSLERWLQSMSMIECISFTTGTRTTSVQYSAIITTDDEFPILFFEPFAKLLASITRKPRKKKFPGDVMSMLAPATR